MNIRYKKTIQTQLNLIRGYKEEIKELNDYKEQAIVALETAEINKLNIDEFQKEIEMLKISHGNPAKRPRSDVPEFTIPSSQTDIVKELEPFFKKITVEITKNILGTIRKESNIPTSRLTRNIELEQRSTSQTHQSKNKNKNINQQYTQSNTEKTFAEIVADKTEKAATIRTVILPSDASIQNQFRKDNMCADLNITKITNKSKNSMTIKCATSEEATSLENKITQKY